MKTRLQSTPPSGKFKVEKFTSGCADTSAGMTRQNIYLILGASHGAWILIPRPTP